MALGVFGVPTLIAPAIGPTLGVYLTTYVGWQSIFCMASAVLILLLFFGGINNPVLMARFLRLATLIGWMAASVIGIKLLCAPDTRQQTRDH